jgi:surfactin synthase thioesterase subunit/glycosyltransferase involved in cell wall biosynthesis
VRILLAQNALYYPAHGGGDKSNRLLMEALAACGHQARVIARTGPLTADDYREKLRERGLAFRDSADAIAFERNGVEVSVCIAQHVRTFLSAQIEAFAPDVILASTDDPAQLLLEPALRSAARVVYLVRATLPAPFGPDSAFPSESHTVPIRECDKVVGVSRYVAEYCRKYAGVNAVHVPISLMESGAPALTARWDNEFVTMVNPCAVKGISIFLALADAMPDVRFAAVPIWGTDRSDAAALAARTNITVLEPVDDIDRLLERTRVVLIPSLWAEARSRMAMEAMLRGVPVLASNTGGLPEAKLGVPYVLPVNPIVRYRAELDERMAPVAEVPPQDIGPWREALGRLLGSQQHYEKISRQSRAAAMGYLKELTVEPFERLLLELPAKKRGAGSAALSEEKRKLLGIRLRQRAPASAWFAETMAGRDERRFWFPHAGAVGSWAPEGWIGIALPGRGLRHAEASFERMEPLAQALATAMEAYLDAPFVFFGHSMGAVVAFEIARELRRRGLRLPRLLIASAARAPRFREASVYTPPPEPSDEELLRQANLPDEPAVRRAWLPPLRADTALYRRYIYKDEPPFEFAVRAYGGADDAGITRAHLEAWREQTTGDFDIRVFPGGHFYLRDESQFTVALEQDLK